MCEWEGGGRAEGDLTVSNETCTSYKICFVHNLLLHLVKLTVTFVRKMHIIYNASHNKQLQFPNCHTCLKIPIEGEGLQTLYAKDTL